MAHPHPNDPNRSKTGAPYVRKGWKPQVVEDLARQPVYIKDERQLRSFCKEHDLFSHHLENTPNYDRPRRGHPCVQRFKYDRTLGRVVRIN